jgi:hypothetical protein
MRKVTKGGGVWGVGGSRKRGFSGNARGRDFPFVISHFSLGYSGSGSTGSETVGFRGGAGRKRIQGGAEEIHRNFPFVIICHFSLPESFWDVGRFLVFQWNGMSDGPSMENEK